MHPLTRRIRRELKAHADPEKAGPMQAYMKTDQPFYGVMAGTHREIARSACGEFPDLTREEWETVILELWNGSYREEMHQAIHVAERYRRYRTSSAWPLFERLVHEATNWDTLDWIAGKLVSPLVLRHRRFERDLVRWSKSPIMWVRRASLIAHLHHRGELNCDLLEETILRLAHEKEFFIRKAIGWILREASKTDPERVERFVDAHADELSGLSKREAMKRIERDRAR